jgi:hypothetical protein
LTNEPFDGKVSCSGGAMLRKAIGVMLGAMLTIATFGCVKNYSTGGNTELDRNWGKSYETAKYQQILNPEAGKNLEPVLGLDGRVDERIMEGYMKGEQKGGQRPTEFGVLTIKQ